MVAGGYKGLTQWKMDWLVEVFVAAFPYVSIISLWKLQESQYIVDKCDHVCLLQSKLVWFR